MSINIVIGICCFLAFLILMFLSVPVPIAMLIPAVIALSIMLTPTAAIQTMSTNIISYFSNYSLTVGPMFGLMGALFSYSGLGGNLFDTVDAFLGHRRGGLAHATVVACAAFGAICGSVPATITTMSAIAYPEMRRKDYAPALAGPTIASAPLISVLIPPSSTFIIYGMATETSVAKLFMGGIVPGILLVFVYMGAIVYLVRRHPDWGPVSERKGWGERFRRLASGGLIEIAIVFLLSMVGMFAGFFTTTEAGAVGSFAILIILFIRRKLDMPRFWKALGDGVRLSAMVFMLLGCAQVFGKMFTVSTIPTVLGNFVASLNVPGFAVLLVIILIYFIIGMFADLLSMMLVTLPIFFPIVCTQLGYSPVWFGVILCVLIGIGGITPPVGNGIFMTYGCVKSDPEASISAFFSGVWPFVITTVAATILMLAVPEIITFLPDLVYG
ncbi:MAG: TRAP transporter large permease [Oscillospiraceae bacterium]|nr:TRAP transporter large permease [Oscillospiraceae bacterium]